MSCGSLLLKKGPVDTVNNLIIVFGTPGGGIYCVFSKSK